MLFRSRRKNDVADALSRLGSRREPVPPNVFLDEIWNPSVKLDVEEDLGCPDRVSELVAHVHERPEWTEPYIAFLLWGELPPQEVIARQIRRRAKAYVVIDTELYKISPTSAFQRCVSPEEGQKILKEIHAGDCGHLLQTFSNPHLLCEI